MSCECYVASIQWEVAGVEVAAETCAPWSDNVGYYADPMADPTGYIEPGAGNGDRLFGKKIVTHHYEDGTWWESFDYGTLVRIIGVDDDCPVVIEDTDYDPEFEYGSVIYPNGSPTSDEFESPVLGSDIRDYAVAHAPYGEWAPYGSSLIYDYAGYEVALAAQAGVDVAVGNTINRLEYGAYNVSGVTVTKKKVRASIARAGLPVRVVYDLWNETDEVAHATDQSFTLNEILPSQEIEIPLVEEKEISFKNVRLFFCPWHVE